MAPLNETKNLRSISASFGPYGGINQSFGLYQASRFGFRESIIVA
jgi:hypothetical protein